MAVRPNQVDAMQAIADLAKKEIYFHGLSTVARLERIIARRHPADQRLLRQVLVQIDAFRWLDEPAGWFTIQGIAKHGLAQSHRQGPGRRRRRVGGRMHCHGSEPQSPRCGKSPCPKKCCLEYCRLMPNVRIEGDRIRSDPPRNWKKILTGVEAKLIGVLKKHGPLNWTAAQWKTSASPPA